MNNKILESLRNFVFTRRVAYVQTFTGPVAETVLQDLARFCRAYESTFHENERVAAQLDGRREVWLRIQSHLRLSPDELFDLVTGGQAKQATMVQSEDED